MDMTALLREPAVERALAWVESHAAQPWDSFRAAIALGCRSLDQDIVQKRICSGQEVGACGVTVVFTQ